MKLSCTRENLHQGLAITSRVSGKNINLPILSNVLLKADKGGLKLVSTNLDLTVTCNIRGKIEQPGEYTVPSKLFFDYVNLLPNEKVDIDLLDDTLSVACGNAKTKIKGITAQEFPVVPPVEGEVSYSVKVSDFQEALSQVLFSAATNESQEVLTGVFLKFHDEKSGAKTLTLAALNGYRLSEKVVKLAGGSDKQESVLVPQRTLAELARVISVFKDDVEASGTIDIEFSDNQIVFKYGSVEVSGRTIEGEYPDYRSIIPDNKQTEVTINRSEFIQAIKTASLFARTGLFDVGVELDPEAGTMELNGADSTRGENTVTIKGSLTGNKNSLVLNFRYLLDGMNAMKSEDVTMRVVDAMTACVFVPEAGPEEKFQYIVMPIRQ